MQFDVFEHVCGQIDFELIFGVGVDITILTLDKEAGVVTLEPASNSDPLFSDSYFLRYFYTEFPLVYLDIPIEVTVIECLLTQAQFGSNIMI